MKSIELLKKLNEKAVFTLSDIRRLSVSKDKDYAKLIVNRLIKRDLIRKVARNVYTTKSYIYSIASHITYPSYISFWSASSFLGYTEQILKTIQVVVGRKVKNVKFDNYLIKFISLKKMYGYKKIQINRGEIFIVEDEKLLIDCFLRYKEMGNFDEIIKVFEKAEISKEKIIEYLEIERNQTIIKRVGYLLEKIKKIDISDKFKLDNNYTVLNPFSKKNKLNSTKWRVKI